MIKKFSYRVAKWMEREGAIPNEDNDCFSYAVYSLLFGLLPVFIVILLGFAFGMLREGLLMIAPFMLIRKFSGGYHLDSSKSCFVFSSVLLTLTIQLINVVVQYEYTFYLTVSVLLSVLCLCVFSPVENHARKLSNKEKKLFHRIAGTLAIVAMIVYLVMLKTVEVQYTVAFGIGIVLVAALEIIGVIVYAKSKCVNNM